MHLITHLRAKVALLFSGALLWCAPTFADDLATPDGYRVLDTYDFTKAPLSTASLAIGETSPGYLWFNGTTQFVKVYTSTTEGFEKFAFQSTGTSRGWSTSANGLLMGSGASRVGGLMGLKAGQIIDIYYTGTTLYTGDRYAYPDGKNVASDTISAKKDTISNETGCRRMKLLTDGAISFEIAVGKLITKIVTYELDEGVPSPTISYTGKSYGARTVSIEARKGTIYYTITTGENTSEATEYKEAFTITATSTITAWATSGDESSEKVTSTITAGAVTTPTFYRPINAGNNNTIEIACETSEASILYKIGNGEYQAYSSAITLDAATTISAQAVYEENGTKFTSEENVVENLTPITLLESRLIDFSLTARGKSEIIPTLSDEATIQIKSADYYTFTMGDYGLIEDFVVGYVDPGQSKFMWWLRAADNSGLYLFAGSNTNFALLNVKAGQYVKITGHQGASDAFRLTLNTTDVATLLSESSKETSTTSFYVYKIIADGNFSVRMGKNAYIDNIQILEEPSSIDVTVGDAGYATLYYNQPTTIPTGVEAYVGALSEDKSVLNLTAVTGTIPANTAVILKAAAGTYTFEPADAADAITGNDLQGTTKELTASSVEGQAYILSSKSGANVGFYKFSGETLAANKAYLVLPAASAAPVVRFNFGEGTEGNVTGIESIEAEQAGAARIFDLQGRSLRQVPQKGMYILNGRKVIR
jgi:hypothetical protein